MRVSSDWRVRYRECGAFRAGGLQSGNPLWQAAVVGLFCSGDS
jgi:hypothetical protein